MAEQSFSVVRVGQPKIQITSAYIVKGILIYFIASRVYMSSLGLSLWEFFSLYLKFFVSPRLLNENYVTFNRKVLLP